MTAFTISLKRDIPWKRLHPLILVLLGFAVYSNTFQVPFLFDDGNYILENPAVKDFDYFLDSARAKNTINQGEMEANFRTRPLTFFTFALNYRLHGLNLAGYHAVNLIIHLICSLLVYRLMLLTLRTPFLQAADSKDDSQAISTTALLAALLFTVHPVQTESVTYISQRFTTLATMLYLTSLVLYIQWRLGVHDPRTPDSKNEAAIWTRPLLYWGSLIAATLAMFTKEITFTLPVIITLCETVFFGRPTRQRLLSLLPFLATMLIIPLIVFDKETEYADVATLSDSFTNAGNENPMLSYLLTQFRVIVTYIRLLLLPINQNIDYDYPRYSSLLQPPVLLSLALLCLLAALAIILLRRAARLPPRQGRWHRLIGFSICWFFVTLSVESTIIPLADLIFEHRLYLPSVGFFLGALGLVELVGLRKKSWRSLLTLLLVIATGSLAVATFSRNILWGDPLSFWQDAVRKSPNKSRPHLNLGSVYKANERYEEAIREYKLALQFGAHRQVWGSAYDSLEEIYRYQKDNQGLQDNYTANLDMLLNSLAQEPNSAYLFNDLGVLYSEMDRNRESEAAFLRAIELKDNFAMPYLNLGNLYSRLNRKDESLTFLRKAAELAPDNKQIQSDLGDEYASRGNVDEALSSYGRAQAIDPDSVDICFKIAYYLLMQGRSGEADGLLLQMASRQSDNARFFHELAVYYERAGRFADAEKSFRKALQLNDKMSLVSANLGAFYLRQGQIDQALEALTQAARLDPRNPDIYYNFGVAYAELGDFAAAAKSYQQVLELLPSDLDAQQQLKQMTQLLHEKQNAQPDTPVLEKSP